MLARSIPSMMVRRSAMCLGVGAYSQYMKEFKTTESFPDVTKRAAVMAKAYAKIKADPKAFAALEKRAAAAPTPARKVKKVKKVKIVKAQSEKKVATGFALFVKENTQKVTSDGTRGSCMKQLAKLYKKSL